MGNKLLRLPNVDFVPSIEEVNAVINYANAVTDRLERAWDDIDGVIDAILKQRPHIERRDSEVSNMSESINKPPTLPCPRCGNGNYQKRDLTWLGVEIMLCPNCGYADRVPAKADSRVAHEVDDREAKPL